MQDFATRVMPCPYCGAPHDVMTGSVDPTIDGGPEVGSLAVCILCACPAFITEDHELRRLTTFEMKRVLANRNVVVAMISSIAASRASDVGDGVPKLRYVEPEER